MLPADPPHNAGYMVAAYTVAPVILVGYLLSLVGRVRRALEVRGRNVESESP
jgi:hypothetical protein